MLKPLHKSLLVVLLLMLSCGQIARAETKVYQYDGKLPFVQMMLTMMDAMGILDRLPSNGGYGRYGRYGGSDFSNPYARSLAARGFSPGIMQGNSPFSSSPWLQSPWSAPAMNGADWGSPNWGVLPVESYASRYSPYGYGPYNSTLANPYWSQDELDGWVNEAWETSTWNPDAEAQGMADARANRPAQDSSPKVNQPVPLVQNFNYITPAPVDTRSNNRADRRSPLSRLAQPGLVQPERPSAQSYRNSPLSKRLDPGRVHPRANQSRANPGANQNQANQNRANQNRNNQNQNNQNQANQNQANQKPKTNFRQKPCVTDSCGLAKPNLNGLWVAQNGEMLGIKDNRYLWADSTSRYLTGQIKIQNEYLLTSVDGHEKLIRFKYKVAGNYLLTMKPSGEIREFTRMQTNQRYPYR